MISTWSLRSRSPIHMNLDISTVNKGDITVESVSGVDARQQCQRQDHDQGCQRGDLGAYDQWRPDRQLSRCVPTGNSEFYTLNGKLSVTFPQSLSADLQFKSWNGSFYTDFPKWEVLPVKVTKNVKKKGRRNGIPADHRQADPDRGRRQAVQIRNHERKHLY